MELNKSVIKLKLASATTNLPKIISGLYKGFKKEGVDVTVWTMADKPAFDLFFEDKFDVLFIEEENIRHNRALIKCLNQNKNVVLIVKSPDNDLPDLDLPLKLVNRIISISTNEKLNTQKELSDKDLTQLVRYGFDPNFYFTESQSKSRAGYVYIGKPSKHVNKVLSEFCNPIGKTNIRIFTPHDCNDTFPFSQYCGQLKSFDEERAIYNSAEFGLDIAEPEQNFINPEVYEVLECGAEVITNNLLVKNVVNLENKEKMVNYSYDDRAKQILDLL